jgi:heme exporter protein C
VVNVPIIHYSVEWWNSLHQGASIMKFDKPSIHWSMLMPLLLMALAFQFYYASTLFQSCRGELLKRERNSKWVTELNEGG